MASTDPRRLAEKIARLEQAVADLQRASQLSHSSIEGSLTANDADGNPVLVMGEQSDGTYGVAAFNGAVIFANAVEPGSITEVEIADDSISTPKLQAGLIGADQLAANIVLSSRLIGGDPNGARAELNSLGLQAYNASGVRTFNVDGATGDVEIIGQFQTNDNTKSRVEIGQPPPNEFYTSFQVIEFEVGDDLGTNTKPGQIIHVSTDAVTPGVSDTMATFINSGNFDTFAQATIELDSGNSLADPKIRLDAADIFATGLIAVEWESWHYVGAAGEPAYQNGWGVSNVNEQLRFRKDVAGNVHIQGRATAGTDNTVVFTLPPEYRPSNRLRFNTLTNSGFGAVAVVIETDGTVTANMDVAASEINLTLPPFYVIA